jgi:hypothetical protein
MKVMIEHDSVGNIQSVFVCVSLKEGKAELQTMPRAQPGNVLTEIDVPQVRHETDLENLRAIKGLYIVKRSGESASLERKA